MHPINALVLAKEPMLRIDYRGSSEARNLHHIWLKVI